MNPEEPVRDERPDFPLWKSIMDATFPSVVKCTVPFFCVDNRRPYQEGSGILLEIGTRTFCLTAAHVLDKINRIRERGMGVYIASSNSARPLVRLAGTIDSLRTSVPGNGREEDIYDIGCMELHSSIADALRPTRRFIHLSEIDCVSVPQVENRFLVLGYPEKGLRMPDKQTIEYNTLPFFTRLYQNERGPISRYDPACNVVLDFDPARLLNQDGDRFVPPNPKGMSGGGIWRVCRHRDDLPNWSAEMVRLVGIQHERNKDFDVLVGTVVGPVIQKIFASSAESVGENRGC